MWKTTFFLDSLNTKLVTYFEKFLDLLFIVYLTIVVFG